MSVLDQHIKTIRRKSARATMTQFEFQLQRIALFACMGSMSLLTACGHSNRFIGEWYAPTDQSHITIDAKQVSVVTADKSQSASLAYRMSSANEIDLIVPAGQVIMTFHMNEDGNSFEAQSVAPYGTETYIATRVK